MEDASEIFWDGALLSRYVFQIPHRPRVAFDADQRPSSIGKSDSGPLDQLVRIRWCQRSDVFGLKKRTPLWLRGSP
jgi:hypothetical protein